jgi:hypothetical protein
MHLLSISPDPSIAQTRPVRPTTFRQNSNVFAHASSSQSKNKAAMRATELYVVGAELELAKPLQESDRKGLESGYASVDAGECDTSSTDDDEEEDDDEGAEGRYFALERALDLVVGVRLSLFFCLHAHGR